MYVTRRPAASILSSHAPLIDVPLPQPGLNAALITGVDIGLWKLMVKNGVDTPQKVEDLAAPLGIDSILLGRLMPMDVGPHRFHTRCRS